MYGKSLAAVIVSILLLGQAAFAQFQVKDIPTRNYDENLTDREKLEQLERKARHEEARAKSFAERGIKYQVARESLLVNLPTTAKRGNQRLDQLNRIYKHASRGAQVWLNYEFDTVKDHTLWLIDQRR